MGHNGKDEIMVHEVEASQCASALIEIKIKTIDSQIYTLRVDKCVPISALKDQIASVTGIVTEQQCLIFHGRVLKDDQLLSAYHVEDEHTLHLIVRQPIPPLSESSTSNTEADPALSAGGSQGTLRFVVGSFDDSEEAFLAFGLIILDVLRSLGTNTEGGMEGIDAMGLSNARNTSGRRSLVQNAVDQTPIPLTSSHPAAIPDSLTTLAEYLNHLRHEFAAIGSNAMGNVQESGSATEQTRIPRPSRLAEVPQSARQLLISEVADCLSNLSTQLENHVNVTDPSTRRMCLSNIIQSGSLLENLGISLLELGRATMMLRHSTEQSVPSEPPRNTPAVSRYQQVSSGESSSTGLDGVRQPVAESSRRTRSVGALGREGDSDPAPGGRGLSELRNRVDRLRGRLLSRRVNVRNRSSESQVAANPSASASAETNEAVANGQAEAVTEAGSNSNRQASLREEEEGAERGDSRRRPEPP